MTCDSTEALEVVIETLDRLKNMMEPQEYRGLLELLDDEVMVRTEGFEEFRRMDTGGRG